MQFFRLNTARNTGKSGGFLGRAEEKQKNTRKKPENRKNQRGQNGLKHIQKFGGLGRKKEWGRRTKEDSL